MLKTWYFSYSAIRSAGQLGGLNAPAPPFLATLLPCYFGQEPEKGPLLILSQAVIHLSMFTCLAHSVEASHYAEVMLNVKQEIMLNAKRQARKRLI